MALLLGALIRGDAGVEQDAQVPAHGRRRGPGRLRELPRTARPLAELREEFGLTPKSAKAVAAGSVTPWEAGGMSEAQLKMGRDHADRLGIDYDGFGASP